ncbi:hypothetical protein GCM10009801_43510 [Streptomyces albiaxialis]|uniref:Nucleoside diphosphate kinase-like domain-containing protein n=1 Tax=Streptomyces albiaxialis TaxID=329523 RepID=A0ABN2W6D0_9ACTN
MADPTTTLSWGPHAPTMPDILSVDEKKRSLYAADVYFSEGYHTLQASSIPVEDFAQHYSLILLRPESAVSRKLDNAVDWLQYNGFRIVAAERVTMDRHSLRALRYFAWNITTQERRRIADHTFTCCQSLVLVLYRKSRRMPTCVELARAKGPATPELQRPGQLRHHLGSSTALVSHVHTPDEPADIIRELGIFFEEGRRIRVCESAHAGADLERFARKQVRKIYEGSEELDLDYDACVERLLHSVDRFLEQQPKSRRPADLGKLAALRAQLESASAWTDMLRISHRLGVPIHPWDWAVVGSRVLPMREEGLVTIIGKAESVLAGRGE